MEKTPDLLNQLRIDRSAPAPAPARRGPWLLAAAIVVAVVAALAWWALREPALPVKVALAQAATSEGGRRQASVLDASGYVTARRQATVSTKVTGKVMDVLIEEGQRVEEGEVMARLEPTDANAQRALVAAELAAAQSNVSRVQAQLALAAQTLRRNQDLVGRQLVSQAALDQARSEHDALVAQLESARRNVEVSRQSLALADIGLDNTIVRAPFAGVVTVKAAQPGEIISPSSAGGGFTRTGIGTVVDMDSLEIQVDVNEAFIGRVAPGQAVEAVLNAYPDWKIPAEVIAIVPTADRSKATVKVRIAFLEKDDRVVPDMGVRVSFLEPPRDEAAAPVPSGVRVPAEAVVERDGRAMAFVVVDGEARRRAVQAEPARDGQRRVASGIAIGEAVVLSPPDELQDGRAVAVQD